MWYTQTGYAFAWRVAIATVICLTIGIGLPETLRWVHRREAVSIRSDHHGVSDTGTVEVRKAPTATPSEQAPQVSPRLTLKPRYPDVKLSFIYAKSPALIIVNPSDLIAREIKWTVVLWNMDLPDRDEPLPIPISTFDWVRPHDESGPENLFGAETVAPLLKPGNRLFGSASVLCPECIRGRTYIIYIIWGESGWFSELESERSGDVLTPSDFHKETREQYFKQLEALVPEASRKQIY